MERIGMSIFKRSNKGTKVKSSIHPRPRGGVRQKKFKVGEMHWAIGKK